MRRVAVLEGCGGDGEGAVMRKRRISMIVVIMIITSITLVTWCVSGSV